MDSQYTGTPCPKTGQLSEPEKSPDIGYNYTGGTC